MEADTAVAGGTNNFKIKVMEYDAETNNQIVSTSNNTSLIGHKQTLIELTEDMVHDYTFQITGYEDGWVQFSTSGPASNDCPNITSEIIKVDIDRTLATPVVSGSSTVCTEESYSISPDPNSESYTWTVTNELRIHMNGQNLTSYTGNETTVPIRPFSGNLGKGDIKVVAHSSNYSDSDEGIKTIRYNGPAPTDVYLNLLTQYGEDAYAMCGNTVYHIYVHNTGPCNTTNYTWNVPSGWTVYYTYNNMISVNSNSSPGGMVEVFANTCCGTNSKILIDYLYGEYCGGYFMTMSPNPADYYVEITFEEESETMNKEDKIKVSKNKYGELGSYRVQIIDKEGNILKEIKSNKLKSTINIRDLRTGTYFLHLITEDEIYKQQLIIN